MSGSLPKVTYVGELKIGDSVIPCAVLEDGSRVIDREGFLHALEVDEIFDLLVASNLKSFIPKKIADTTKPIPFRNLEGIEVPGYLAELLSQICRVYLDARDANALTEEQEPIAAKCSNLLKGLAVVGIAALNDEATGEVLSHYLQGLIRRDLFRKRNPVQYHNNPILVSTTPY